jgi:heme-degrading monooxygenase HmoA
VEGRTKAPPGWMRTAMTVKRSPMVHILGEVAKENLEQFVGAFSRRGAMMRGKHGNHRTQLFKVAEEEGKVVVLLEWESREAFEGFSNDPRVRETISSSGTVGPPGFTFLEKVGEFPS